MSSKKASPSLPKDSGSGDEWEYYDDNTILSDFWSTWIKTSATSPLTQWLEAFESVSRTKSWANYTELSTPDNVFKEFWRVEVPQLLSPRHGFTSLNQKFDEKRIQERLLNPLNAFICGTEDFEQVFQALSGNDGPPALCGRPFQAGEPTYGCKDCGQDATCVLCDDCFSHSTHKNHRYRMSTSLGGGGYCDCGDSEAFLKDSMCDKHLAASKNSSSIEDVLKSFPTGMVERARMILLQICKYVLDVTVSRQKFSELLVGGKDKETWPDLKYPFDFSRYCSILINDASHTFPQVISALQNSLQCTSKDANDLAQFTDKEGRAILKVGNYADCAVIRERIGNTSRLSGKKLKCDVIPAYLVAHQNFAVRCLKWVVQLLQKSSGFRKIFSDIAFSADVNEMIIVESSKSCLAESILLLDTKFWKEIRKGWFNILVEGILKDYDSKRSLAQMYIKHYEKIMTSYIADDQEEDATVINLSVQMFTVPSVATYLVTECDAFSVMMSFFYQQLEEQKIVGDGQLILEQWMEDEHAEYSRTQQCLTDLSYLMSVTPSPPLSKLLESSLLIACEKYFLPVLECLQGADPTVREALEHVIEESREWEFVSALSRSLYDLAEKVIAWMRLSKDLLLTLIRLTAKMIHQNEDNQTTNVTFNALNGFKTFDINDVNVLSESVSVHNPLHQFLATVLGSFSDARLKEWGLSDSAAVDLIGTLARRVTEFGPMMDLTDSLITAQAVLATIKIGLWRRNGTAVLGQQYCYHMMTYAKKNDLIMMQFGAIHDGHGGDHFLVTLIHRFGLMEWASGFLDTDEEGTGADLSSEKSEDVHGLGDEFLSLVLAILMERNNPEVGCVTPDDELELRVIQILCIGAMSHSKLLKVLQVDGKDEAMVDEILQRVAELVVNPKERVKKVHKLKKEYEPRYNPFYYYYTQSQRDQAMSNMMHPERPDGQASSIDVLLLIAPPKMPKLNRLFANLPSLASAETLLQVVKVTLKRWQKPAASSVFTSSPNRPSSLTKQLHKVLFLINIALQDDMNPDTSVSDKFTQKAEQFDLLKLLLNLDCPEDLTPLVRHTVKILQDARLAILNKKPQPTSVTTPETSTSDSVEANARKRRAMESRAKILAEMSKRQTKFSDIHQDELNELTKEEKPQHSELSKESSRNMGSAESPVAVGPKRTSPAWQDKTFDCSVCKQQECVSSMDLKKNAFVLLAFSSKSAILGLDKSTQDFRQIHPNFLPASLHCAPLVTTCGHAMHSKCYQTFYDNILRRERLIERPRAELKLEFLCPGCQRLSNVAVPILPCMRNLVNVSATNSKDTFESWMNNLHKILKENLSITTSTETNSASSGGIPFIDITRYTLKSEETSKAASLLKPPQSLAEMVEAFGLAHVVKYFVDQNSPTEDRVLQLAIQAAAFTIHTSQAEANPEASNVYSHNAKQLINPVSHFHDECLRSLIKMCFTLPLCNSKGPSINTMTSNALFLLSNCLMHDQDKTFLDFDAVALLIALVSAIPALPLTKKNSRHVFGEFDHHILHFVTVLHLVQILSGYQGEDVVDETVSGASAVAAADDAAVVKLAAEVSAVVGWSDRHINKLKNPSAVIKQKLIHFLRCASIFFHAYTDVPLPVMSSTQVDTFSGLASYLGIPSTLAALLSVPGTSDLINSLLSFDNLHIKSTLLHYPVRLRTLLDLPKEYTTLLKQAANARCPRNVTGEVRHPTLCLLCGSIVCSQVMCCEKSKLGGLNIHARQCCAGTGIFLRIRDSKIVLLADLRHGALVSAPYVDAYGETDDDLSRGNPLFLDESMYENLRKLWISHEVANKVSSLTDREFLVFESQWASL